MTAKHPHEDKRRARRLARALKGWMPSPAPIVYALPPWPPQTTGRPQR